MLRISSTPPLPPPIPARPRQPSATARRGPPLSIRFSLEALDGGPEPASAARSPVLVAQFSPPPLATDPGLRRSPELGLLSLLFVISMALGSAFLLAVVSLPAMFEFKRLSTAVDKLSRVVSEEVPGTLSSLKLSGLEINDLTSQLNNIRQRLSGSQHRKAARTKKQGSHGGRGDPLIN